MITGTVVGNVGREPTLRQTQSGKTMATFSVASTDRKDGPTTWVEVIAFDEQAEMVSETLKKGARVMVTGRLAVEEYEKKDGSKGYSLKMMADDVGRSLKWRPRQQRDGSAEPAGVAAEAEVGFTDKDDEIPF